MVLMIWFSAWETLKEIIYRSSIRLLLRFNSIIGSAMGIWRDAVWSRTNHRTNLPLSIYLRTPFKIPEHPFPQTCFIFRDQNYNAIVLFLATVGPLCSEKKFYPNCLLLSDTKDMICLNTPLQGNQKRIILGKPHWLSKPRKSPSK